MMSPADQFPDLDALLAEIELSGPYASIKEVNRLLSERTSEYNARPQVELGGLSPNEMTTLLYGDWESHGTLRLNDQLALADLGESPILLDARTLLAYVRDHEPIRETPARNFPRAVVADLLPLLRMPELRTRRGVLLDIAPKRYTNESDVYFLTILHFMLVVARLLLRRKGLRITVRARDLLADDRAGELYALLFRTLFRQIDLRSLDVTGEHPGLQSTIGYSFYKLHLARREWASAETLASVAWLESAKDPPSEWEAANEDFRHYAFRHRVLDPLVEFGLFERRELPGTNPWLSIVEFRRAPLFDRFLRFDLHADRPKDPFLMR
ncbi:MAG: hypothetical protein ACREOJ_17205 [Gemmatimonadaceae bacterium]